MLPRIILLIFGASVLTLAFRRLRAYRLKERHMLLFVLTGLPFFVLGDLAPTASAGSLEFSRSITPTVSLLCVTAFFIVMIFELLTIVSLQDRKIATLAQIVGIMMEKHGMSDRPLDDPPATPQAEDERELVQASPSANEQQRQS